MKDYSEMMICNGCKAVRCILPCRCVLSGPMVHEGCSNCGSLKFSIGFVPKNGSLVVWDDKSEEIFPENIFFHWLVKLIRRVL